MLISMLVENQAPTFIHEIVNLPWPGAIWATVMNVGIFGRALHQAAVFYRPTEPALAAWLDRVFGAGLFVDHPTQIGSTLFVDQPYWVGQAWTLEIELCFYLVAPFIVKSWRRLVIWFTASLLLRLGLIVWPGHPIGQEIASVGYHLFPTTLCLFLLGSGAYYLYRRVKGWKFARIGVVLAPSAIVIGAVLAWLNPDGFALFPSDDYYFDAPGMWLAYILFAAMLPFIFTATKSNRVDRMIGELSYPVYLIQAVSMFFSRSLFGEEGLYAELCAVLMTCASAGALLLSVDVLGYIAKMSHRQFIRRLWSRPVPRPAGER
jgi:peptidoglycan/LPS O-acetylase OafA/YrhL